MHNDTFFRLALSRVNMVGPILTRLLMDTFGSAEAVFAARPKELRLLPGIGEKLIGELQLPRPQVEATQLLRFAERHDIRIYHYLDEDYPTRMHHHPHAPTLFFCKGEVDLNATRTVAVVGTRKPTARGIRQTEHLVHSLRAYQPLVISGLAYGVDICAHKAALKLGLPTLGILGSGLNAVYPASHRDTAQRMLKNGGLLSTYPHWKGPEREHFPARNRIVATLADIVVVVESAERGGSIITANMATDLGKPVGAFPGRFTDKSSTGCNQLIKATGHLIESGEDVAEILQWNRSEFHDQQGSLFLQLDTQERAVVALLSKQETTEQEDLRKGLAWTNAQLASTLLSMELKGLIKTAPGNRYRLAH